MELDIMQLLYAHMDKRDPDRKMPLDYAVERNNEQLVKLLLEHA